jgi:hypothetical protein
MIGLGRRGHRYGTILVDLEWKAVIDLLPDRQAESPAGYASIPALRSSRAIAPELMLMAFAKGAGCHSGCGPMAPAS